MPSPDEFPDGTSVIVADATNSRFGQQAVIERVSGDACWLRFPDGAAAVVRPAALAAVGVMQRRWVAVVTLAGRDPEALAEVCAASIGDAIALIATSDGLGEAVAFSISESAAA